MALRMNCAPQHAAAKPMVALSEAVRIFSLDMAPGVAEAADSAAAAATALPSSAGGRGAAPSTSAMLVTRAGPVCDLLLTRLPVGRKEDGPKMPAMPATGIQ
jgi:hypothetical protein